VDENPNDNGGSSSKKAEANRRNAQLSTGPRTEDGKSQSRRNALRHGILASALLITKGEGAEHPAEFEELLEGLSRDLSPVGALEEMQVEKIAVCWWRQKRALQCEAGLVTRAFVPDNKSGVCEDLERAVGFGPNLEREAIRDHLILPLGADLDRILRYETTIQRELSCAINQLERLQRARKGEHVPAPVSVQVSSDQ
jgi:hypothetical protein